jgi:hypothetical protein
MNNQGIQYILVSRTRNALAYFYMRSWTIRMGAVNENSAIMGDCIQFSFKCLIRFNPTADTT